MKQLNRLFHPKSRRSLVVAVDHAHFLDFSKHSAKQGKSSAPDFNWIQSRAEDA